MVERFLPLYSAYRSASKALDAAHDEHERLGHYRWPFYEYGFGRHQASVKDGDVSAIEAYYAKCIDEAETAAQRTHLRQRLDFHVKGAKQYWAEWDAFHRDAGLYDLEQQRSDAEKALGEIEEAVLTSRPTTMAGAAAVVRVAMAYAWDEDFEPEDQPSEVRALRSALAFFGQEGGAA